MIDSMWKVAAERFRVLRRQRRLTQIELGRAAGVSRGMVQRIESARWENLAVGALERVALALGARLQVALSWNGAQLDRLVDAGHAELQNAFDEMLGAAGWLVAVEVSFNHYGDRGRYDLMALHPASGTVLVIEIKTAIGDVQATLGTLDVKLRLAMDVARAQGWRPLAIVPALVLAGERQQHRIVAAHAALFARFALRGISARAWLRRPATPPSGLLVYLPLTNARLVSIRKANRGQRVRKGSVSVTNATFTAQMSSRGADPPS